MPRNYTDVFYLLFLARIQELLQKPSPVAQDAHRIRYLAIGVVIALVLLSAAPSINHALNISSPSTETPSYIESTYTFNPGIQGIVEEMSLSRHGKQIFLRNQPELVTKSELNTLCPEELEAMNIIGCFKDNQKIYIYNINHSQLTNQKIITAAHELLHAGYEQISAERRVELNQEMERFYITLQDQELSTRMANYEQYYASSNRSSDWGKFTELYAIIGTEFRNIPQSLENSYRTYFVNRQDLVGKHEQMSKYIEGEVAKLNSLKSNQAYLLGSSNQYYAIHQSCARNWSYYYDCYDSSWANYLAAFARYRSAFSAYYAQWEVVNSITRAYKDDVPGEQAVKGIQDKIPQSKLPLKAGP